MSLILQITQDSAMDSQESNSAKEEKKLKKSRFFICINEIGSEEASCFPYFPLEALFTINPEGGKAEKRSRVKQN